METQKIASLLDEVDNKSSKFAIRKLYVINDQNITDYGERHEDIHPLNLKLKSLNQILVIIEAHIFL